MRKHLFSILILIVLSFNISAQNSAENIKIYDKDGLSFNYPVDWEITDQSNSELQQLKFSLPNSSGLIYITSPNKLIKTSEQLDAAQDSISDRFIENIKQKFSYSSTISTSSSELSCFNLRDKSYAGTIIRGKYQNEPSLANILPVFLEHRFINFVFIRHVKDNFKTSDAWKKITETVKIVTPKTENLPALDLKLVVPSNFSGVINGRAVSLPKPRFPPGVRGSGRVEVAVVLNETGNVEKVKSASGPKEFINSAIAAAKKAQFTPSYVCQRPVKITGIINYDFIP